MKTIDLSSNSHNPKIVPQSFRDQTAKLVPQSHKSLDCGNGTSPECGTVRIPQARPLEPASPILPPGPLAMPGVVRIRLSEAAGNALAAVGEAFVVVGKGRYPDSDGRMVIYCQPAQLAVVNAACDVATGTHRAVKIKPAKVAPPARIRHD